MSIENAIKFAAGQTTLTGAPIRSEWILEGNPVARNIILSSSADGTACTLIWDCTAGRFNWHYDIDETVHVLEGSVILKDTTGVSRRISAGDTVFFPAGTSAEWTVDTYIRKVAFCRIPLPRKFLFAKRVYHGFKRLLVGGSGKDEAVPAMFQSG